jgi:endonuclease/exonuclease/phosphatase family metal-dependent hydrolase
MPRRQTVIRIGNLNAYKLGPEEVRASTAWDARVQAVKDMAPEILGLQEIVVDEDVTHPHEWDATASEVIRDFAADCGLTASVAATPGRPHGIAMAANVHRPWYTALSWNPNTVRVLPKSYRPFGAPDFWHGLTTARFDIGAREPLLIASYHGDPFRPNARADEALRIKGIFRRTGGVKPGLLIGDFNGLSSATIAASDGTRQYYDAEPYTEQDHDDLEYQLLLDTVGTDQQLANRRQTQVLLRRGYMVDAAAHLNAPWHPTVGYWEDGRGDPDPWGERRIDLILATRPVAPALVGYTAHRSPAAEAAADHLPISADIDPHKIVQIDEEAGR